MDLKIPGLFLILIILVSTCDGAPSSKGHEEKMVVIMLDGCRWDYFSRAAAEHPGYQKFKDEGVVANYVQPIFPASSLQSWTTISTGLKNFSK